MVSYCLGYIATLFNCCLSLLNLQTTVHSYTATQKTVDGPSGKVCCVCMCVCVGGWVGGSMYDSCLCCIY